MTTKFFLYPFGVSGDRTAVPNDTQTDGSVSYEDGYGPDYSANPGSDPDAINIERTKWNSIMFDVTTAIRQYQTLGVPDFITSGDNEGTPFSYSQYARVRYDPGSGMQVYVSLVNSNIALPTDATKWSVVSALTDGNKGDITVSSGGTDFEINAGAVGTNELAALSVTAAKIANNTITATQVANNAIGNIQAAQMTALTMKANFSGSTANPQDVTLQAVQRALYLVNAQNLVPSSIAGFLPSAQSFSSNASASMTIAGGICSDSSNQIIMGFGAPGSAQWAWNITNGNAPNGYQGGTTLPNSTTIHFYVIAKPDLSAYASFASTSLTPTLPGAYAGGYYRRIFSIPTNSSGVLLLATGIVEGAGGSIHYGLNTSILDIAVTNLNAFTQYTLSVPQGINVVPIWRYNMPTTGKGISVFSSILGTTALPAFSDSGWTSAPGYDTAFDSGTTNYVMPKTDGSLITDTSGRIAALSTGASTALYFMTCGWEDFRRG